MNNVACSRVGAMLYLDIQKREEAMKTSKFQNFLVGTTVCMKRLDISTKRCGQLTSNDSWFSSVKTDEGVAAVGVGYCGPVKTIHKGFCWPYRFVSIASLYMHAVVPPRMF